MGGWVGGWVGGRLTARGDAAARFGRSEILPEDGVVEVSSSVEAEGLGGWVGGRVGGWVDGQVEEDEAV